MEKAKRAKGKKTKEKEENAVNADEFVIAIRVRGRAKLKQPIILTLKMLRLTRINHCVVLRKDKVYSGMLQKVKDYITWGDASGEALKMLKDKKGDLKVFRLHPPRKGYGGVKRPYPLGALGFRGKEIITLLKKMV